MGLIEDFPKQDELGSSNILKNFEKAKHPEGYIAVWSGERYQKKGGEWVYLGKAEKVKEAAKSEQVKDKKSQPTNLSKLLLKWVKENKDLFKTRSPYFFADLEDEAEVIFRKNVLTKENISQILVDGYWEKLKEKRL